MPFLAPSSHEEEPLIGDSRTADRRHSLHRPKKLLILLGCSIFILTSDFGIYFTQILGSSFSITTRSLATALILPDHVGTLYSAISISQALRTFFSGPISAYLFKLGIHWESFWVGLPFLQSAVLCLVCTIGLCFVRLGGAFRMEDEDEDCDRWIETEDESESYN